MSIANGNYVLCDKDNYVYTNAGHIMARYKLKNPNNPKEGIAETNEACCLAASVYIEYTCVSCWLVRAQVNRL